MCSAWHALCICWLLREAGQDDQGNGLRTVGEAGRDSALLYSAHLLYLLLEVDARQKFIA